MSEMVERVARALMGVRARLPGDPNGKELPVLAIDPDFDDLPTNAAEGCDGDEITQEAVLRLARAAIEAMREPTPAMEDAGNSYESVHALGQWQVMIDAALK